MIGIKKGSLRIRIFVLTVFFIWSIFGMSMMVYADGLPKEVKVVENEQLMIKQLLKSLKKHKTYCAFYYDGIEKDFARYHKSSPVYRDFFDKLAMRDGYTMGVVSGSCVTICGTEKKYAVFQFGYLTTKKQEIKINRMAKRIVKRIGKGSRIRRIRMAHDYLLAHMTYDSRYFSPYDAFAKGKGICMSYALAFQRLMQEMKIPCLYIKGKNHAWNMVKVGGYWYNIDVTWDDSGNNAYRYFLKADKDFPRHKRPSTKLYRSLRLAKSSY